MSPGGCRTCRGEIDIKLNSTGVCFSCQAGWLLVSNSTKKLFALTHIAVIERNTDQEEGEVERMLADHGGNITDPRFIPTGADGTSSTTHNIINRALGDKQEPIDDCNVVSKMSRVWAQPSTKTIRSRPIQREELLNTSIPMSNRTMIEVLNLLQDQCNLIDIVNTDLFKGASS